MRKCLSMTLSFLWPSVYHNFGIKSSPFKNIVQPSSFWSFSFSHTIQFSYHHCLYWPFLFHSLQMCPKVDTLYFPVFDLVLHALRITTQGFADYVISKYIPVTYFHYSSVGLIFHVKRVQF